MELNIFPVVEAAASNDVSYIKDYIFPIFLNIVSIVATIWIARRVFLINHQESQLKESILEANRFILFVSELQQHFINMKNSYFENLSVDCFNRVYSVPNGKKFTHFNSFDPSKFIFLIPTLESKFKEYTHMSPVALTNLLQNSFEVDNFSAIRAPLYSEFRDVFSRNYSITEFGVQFDKEKIINEFGVNKYAELVDYTERYICYTDRILLATEALLSECYEVFKTHFGEEALKKYGPLLQLGEHPSKKLIISQKPVNFYEIRNITNYTDSFILANYTTTGYSG